MMSASQAAVTRILGDALSLGDRARSFTRETRLLGSLPEFDSMVVVSIIAALEEEFGIVIDDDEVSAETFESVGSLVAFVDAKLGA